MTTKLKKITIYCSVEEKTELNQKLKQLNENISNHFRKLEGWQPLRSGAPKGNKNAVKANDKEEK